MTNYYGNQKMYYMQPRLPYEYQEIEYIESTGTQWIDTDCHLFSVENHKITIDFSPTAFYNYNSIWGSTLDADTMEGWVYLDGKLASRYNSVRYGTDNKINLNQRYLLELEKDGGTLFKYVDGVSFGSGAVNTKLNDSSFLLGKSGADYGKYKLYSCKLYMNSIPVRDYVPCYRKSDGATGLFDLIEMKFYQNKGTGEFIKGDNSTKIIKFVKILGTIALPYEYQQVEYIESTGTQYIDTGVVPKSSQKLSIKYEPMQNSVNQVFFGCRTSGSYDSSLDQIYLNLYPYDIQFYSGTLHTLLYKDVSTGVVYNDTFDFVGGTYSSDFNDSAQQNMFLFALNALGTPLAHAYLKVYSCKIYDNDILIRDFIPCYHKSDGTTGLFDLVNRRFYENNGTGEFIKGSVVNNAINKFVKIIPLSSLPIDYQEVEYIESTGTQYIDTNFYPTPKTKFCADLYFDYTNGKLSTTNAAFIGISGDFSMNFGSGAGQEQDIYIQLNSYNDDASRVTVTTAIPKNTVVHFELDAAKRTYICGTKKGKVNTEKTIVSEYAALLFGQYKRDSNSYMPFKYFPMRVYNCKFYDNEKLVRNFIPCYRKSDRVAGLYDVVDQKFYENDGTGEFNIGAEIINLPYQYQRVEYIESNEAYIDTEVLANENLSFETTAQFMSKGTASKSIYGGRLSSNPTDGVQLHYVYSNSVIQFIYNDTSAGATFDLNKNTYKVNKNKLYINGTLSSEIPSASFSGPSIYLFATNTNGQMQFNAGTTLRMWYFKIWDEDTLIRDYIPCYRKSDGVAGLYDLVSKKFYTNAGTGEFINGGDIR